MPCTYGLPGEQHRLLSIGWLAHGHAFPRGPCEAAFVSRLRELLTDAWAPVDFCGVHVCDLCPAAKAPSGADNLFVPGATAVFVAPAMSLHDIETHTCCPPDAFIAAVMACPAMRSPTYHAAIAAHYQPFPDRRVDRP